MQDAVLTQGEEAYAVLVPHKEVVVYRPEQIGVYLSLFLAIGVAILACAFFLGFRNTCKRRTSPQVSRETFPEKEAYVSLTLTTGQVISFPNYGR